MRQLKALDLFCGVGGVSYGLSQVFPDITGIDIRPQPNYPFNFIQGNVLALKPEDLQYFDFIWASPPCQHFISPGRAGRSGQVYHNLIPFTRNLLNKSGKPYIIENIMAAPLLNPITLCGEMFGLKVIRHRKFESNVLLLPPAHTPHKGSVHRFSNDGGYYFAVYGHEIGTLNEWRTAMGIPWAKSKKELSEAIPPAYSECLVRQL